MATPKKKVSKSRRNMRRYSCAYKFVPTATTSCAACGDFHRPHRVCKCGAYNGKSVIPQAIEPTAQA